MPKFIPYGHQWVDDSDIEGVVKVLKSDWITQGPKIAEFEGKIANYCGAKYAVVLSSGTAALHAAYYAAGIKEGDEIITSPITFLSTANAAIFLGAKPVFVDIEPDTGNINPILIEQAITDRTKVIAPVDFGGHPVKLDKIAEISHKHDLLLLEDACHALGAEYRSKDTELSVKERWIKIGNCRYSDMTVFSFHPIKSITTGEGGSVLTNNEEFYEKLIMFRQHGVTKDRNKFKVNVEDLGDWYYEMHLLGYNYRLTDIQCALGISQLKKLNKFIQRRRKIVKIYQEAFKDNEYFDLPEEKIYAKSSFHLYPIRLKAEMVKKKVLIFKKLRERGLGVQVHYIPIYWQPYYQTLGYKRRLCPKAEEFYRKELSIPLFPQMNDKEIEYVIKTVKRVFENA